MSQPSLSVEVRSALRLVRTEPEHADFVGALKKRRPWAERKMVEDHTPYVLRLICRIVGAHADLDDLAEEVFVRALDRIDELEDAGLKRWLGAFAVNVAREALRKRRRWGWLVLAPPSETPEIPSTWASPEVHAREAAHVLVHVVRIAGDEMPREREDVAFASVIVSSVSAIGRAARSRLDRYSTRVVRYEERGRP
jgi:DNA-directed RNA polymerase specialized sigma24 family protein